MNCETCIKEKEIELLREDVRVLKEYRERDKEDIYAVREMCQEIKTDVKLLNQSVKGLYSVVQAVQADVETLKNKPYKKYDKLSFAAIVTAINLIVTSIYTYIVK